MSINGGMWAYACMCRCMLRSEVNLRNFLLVLCDKVALLCLEFMSSRNLPVPTSLVLGLQALAIIPAFLYRSAGQPQALSLARHPLHWAVSPAPSWVALYHACRTRSIDLSMDTSGTLSRLSGAMLTQTWEGRCLFPVWISVPLPVHPTVALLAHKKL